MTMKTSTRKVALLVHTANDWTRMVLKGIASYAREASDSWNVFLEPRGFHEKLSLPKKWQGDGVILRLTHAGLQQAVMRRKLPAVNVSWLGRHSETIPKVVSDERGCAEVGVRHLRDKGYSNIAFVGPSSELDYRDTIDRECQRLAGVDYRSLPQTDARRSGVKSIVEWLKQLPTPLGILAWNTAASKSVLDACTELGLHVPHDVGIVCIEHDHLMASMSDTPLTSIDQDPLSVGYEAARLLDSMMNGARSPDEPILIRPQGVVCRQSTEAAKTEDEVVKAALQYIKENYTRPIRVGDICAILDVSRRQLEHRFRLAINSTPANEIRMARLTNVKRLLVETSFSLDKIAVLSGYDYSEVMTRAFKQKFGYTPGEFRKSR